ncbi:unnamed protein product [Cladocopium goreaui]|uniref:Uncharacterized protein n=1 Tax=Cladocopium goreaui TaxID=2562237 RepID=A0A9P1CZN2_9DINO|nr:unnamed protein product [Cladocopium goreaui]
MQRPSISLAGGKARCGVAAEVLDCGSQVRLRPRGAALPTSERTAWLSVQERPAPGKKPRLAKNAGFASAAAFASLLSSESLLLARLDHFHATMAIIDIIIVIIIAAYTIRPNGRWGHG